MHWSNPTEEVVEGMDCKLVGLKGEFYYFWELTDSEEGYFLKSPRPRCEGIKTQEIKDLVDTRSLVPQHPQFSHYVL